MPPMARARARRRADQPRSHTPLVLVAVPVIAATVTITTLLLWPTTPRDRRDSATSAASGAPSPGRPHAPVDLSALPIGHTLVCEALADSALTAALGGEVAERDGYSSGERGEIVPGVTDVAHEDSCSYASDGFRARVWVFAAPVRRAQARELVGEARRDRHCTYPDQPTDFGTPGLTSVCTGTGTDRSPAVTVTLAGLFVDAWLSCELAAVTDPGPAPDAVLARADRWCLHVATTLGAVP